MKLLPDKIPHPFFPLYYFVSHNISNFEVDEKLAKYFIERLDYWLPLLQDSGSKLFDSCLQLKIYLSSISRWPEMDSDDTPMLFVPNFIQHCNDDEIWEPQLPETQYFIDNSLSSTDAYIFENKFLYGCNPSLCDGLYINLNNLDSFLTMLIMTYLTGKLHMEDSEIKKHREGTKRNRIRLKQELRPKFLTLLANHFKIIKGPKSKITIHRHCEEIFDSLIKIRKEAKNKIKSKGTPGKLHPSILDCFIYFFKNRERFDYSRRIDLKSAESICLTS